MRLRKVKDVEEKIKKYSYIIIDNPYQYKCKWNELFKNSNTIHLEIGMGKGKFIKEKAKRDPNINFIGCELSNSIIYKAAKSVEQESIPNLLMINFDALKLNDVFEKGEIEKIYLNFSDPWPKSRHEKRRLTSNLFLHVYEQIIVKDGIIEFKSDNRKLFEYSVISLHNEGYEFLDLCLDLHNSGYEDIVTTEYEDRFSGMGNVIYFIKVKMNKELSEDK